MTLKHENTKQVLHLLSYMLLWLHLWVCCIIPLLESNDSLVQFAQHDDVFICDLMVAINVCRGQLHSLYNDGNSSFSSDEFWAFQGLLDGSLYIHMKLVGNLNDSTE
jgi:hypothetical protein